MALKHPINYKKNGPETISLYVKNSRWLQWLGAWAVSGHQTSFFLPRYCDIRGVFRYCQKALPGDGNGYTIRDPNTLIPGPCQSKCNYPIKLNCFSQTPSREV